MKKIGRGLEHVRTNLRFFGLSLSFYSSFYNYFTAADLKVNTEIDAHIFFYPYVLPLFFGFKAANCRSFFLAVFLQNDLF